MSEPRAFLDAEWRHLVMLTYEIDPGVLRPLVPAGTTLDLSEGRALVSMVGFRFLRTRLLGVPVPFHRNFDEVNLRFYVRRDMPDGEVRRGVTFVRELVPRRAIALVARLAYAEPYLAVPMQSTVPDIAAEGVRRFAWRFRGETAWQHLAATAVGAPTFPTNDSAAAFVTEHYWGYTPQRDGGTVEYHVTHPQWRVWNAESPELVADVPTLYGPAFASTLGGAPMSPLIAEGSAITVYRPQRIRKNRP